MKDKEPKFGSDNFKETAVKPFYPRQNSFNKDKPLILAETERADVGHLANYT